MKRTAGLLSVMLLVACAAAEGEDPPHASATEGASDDAAQTGDTADPKGDASEGDGAADGDPTPPADDGPTSSSDGTGGSDGTIGSTGGDTDEGTSTGEPDAPGLGCDGRTDLLLCDDFEGDAIDESIWTILDDGGGTVVVDDQMPHHGERSLHIHLPLADAAHAGVRTTLPFPVPDNHFFGRAMFFVTPEAPQTHSSTLTARGDLDGATAQYRLDSNGGEFNSRYTHTPTVEQHGGLRKFGYDVPAGEWLCIEWEYDGGHDTMRYFMNGEEVESMTVTEDSEEQPWVAPIFEDFEVGFRTFQAGSHEGGYDVYWDAVALATFRIGCGE